MRRVYLKVVGHSRVDHNRLRGGHPRDAVRSCGLTARGDRAVAPDADPQHGQPGQGFLPPLLGRRSAEEDVIDDDPGARLSVAAMPCIQAASSAR
jgi:hypothetical protein